MEVVAVPSLPKQSHLFTSADEIINSLLDLRPEKWGLPAFEDCEPLLLLFCWFLIPTMSYAMTEMKNSGIEGTLPIEPWYIGGPVIKGFGRGSKVLGIPTGF